jgi:hypothetical protein
MGHTLRVQTTRQRGRRSASVAARVCPPRAAVQQVWTATRLLAPHVPRCVLHGATAQLVGSRHTPLQTDVT